MVPLPVAAGYTPASMPMESTTRLIVCRAMSRTKWPTSGLGPGRPTGEYCTTVHLLIWTVTPGLNAKSSYGGMRTRADGQAMMSPRSEEHTSELQSRGHLVCRLLLEKKKKRKVPTRGEYRRR